MVSCEASKTSGMMMTLKIPVSSSTLRKNNAFGCSGSLPHNYTARDADDDAVPSVSQLVSGCHTQRVHTLPLKMHRVTSDREPGTVIVGGQPFIRRHLQ